MDTTTICRIPSSHRVPSRVAAQESTSHGVPRNAAPGRSAGRPTVVIRTGPSRPDGCAARSAGGRSGSRRSAATYRRRRAVVGSVLAAVVALSILVAHDVLVGPGGDPAVVAADRPASDLVTVTARAGDTLWSIGEAHHGSLPIREYVDALIALNGGSAIQVGQSVRLP